MAPKKLAEFPRTEKTNLKDMPTFQVSEEEWERYGNELWIFIENLDDLCEKLLEPGDEEDRSAHYLIRLAEKKMRAFVELTNRRAWTDADFSTYEDAFQPFLAFIGLMRDPLHTERNIALEQLIGISIPTYRVIQEGISLFRSRLPKEGGAE